MAHLTAGLLLVASASGCVQIQTRPWQMSERVTRVTASERAHGPWRYEADATVHRSEGSRVVISGHVNRFRDCEHVETRHVERRAVEPHQPPNSTIIPLEVLLGLTGAGLLAWGIDDHRRGEPFERKNEQGNDEPTGAALKVGFGAALSLLLVDATIATIRSIDTVIETERDDEQSVPGRCGLGPAARAKIGLSANGIVIATTQTVADGAFRLPLALTDLDDGASPPVLLVESTAATGATATLMALAERARRARVEAARPSDLLLHGVRLKNAGRAVLQAALSQAGATALASASQNIMIFAADALGFEGMQRLKLMFDANDIFVQAKYEGELADAAMARLLGQLEQLYGKPKLVSVGQYVWVFPDDLQIVLARSSSTAPGEHATSLLYVDRFAEAALRREILRKEAAAP